MTENRTEYNRQLAVGQSYRCSFRRTTRPTSKRLPIVTKLLCLPRSLHGGLNKASTNRADIVVARLTLRLAMHGHHVADGDRGHQRTFGDEQQVFLVREFGQRIGLREQCLVDRDGKNMDAGIDR
jgi:hypothetical protein